MLALAGQERVILEPVLTEPARLTHDWSLDGSGAWRVGDGVLTLATAGTPVGPIRRPSALAILDTATFAVVTLDVDIRSTAALPEVTPRRDALLIVGYQSPTRFYYVHLSAVRDDVHNGIFLVDGADRRRIDVRSATAPLQDQAWHRTRVERDPASGRIAVFYGESAAPIMEAVDTTLAWGRVGVGSFDDTAEFRRVRIDGQIAPLPPSTR